MCPPGPLTVTDVEQEPHPARITNKTRLFALIVIFSNALGNFFLTWGLRRWGGRLSIFPLDYIAAIFNPWVGLGVLLLILWLLSRMALLSWADLSYVLPVTALGYVVTALIGRFWLGEHVSPWRWAGTLLIVAGIALVARTRPNTTVEAETRAESLVREGALL
jgi:drug/metabolite transporter (DMT)-like permease